MKQVNKGSVQLSDTEVMRMQVIDLELKARFWKAQYELRYYTLEAEKIHPEYEKYVQAQQAKNEAAIAKLKEQPDVTV